MEEAPQGLSVDMTKNDFVIVRTHLESAANAGPFVCAK